MTVQGDSRAGNVRMSGAFVAYAHGVIVSSGPRFSGTLATTKPFVTGNVRMSGALTPSLQAVAGNAGRMSGTSTPTRQSVAGNAGRMSSRLSRRPEIHVVGTLSKWDHFSLTAYLQGYISGALRFGASLVHSQKSITGIAGRMSGVLHILSARSLTGSITGLTGGTVIAYVHGVVSGIGPRLIGAITAYAHGHIAKSAPRLTGALTRTFSKSISAIAPRFVGEFSWFRPNPVPAAVGPRFTGDVDWELKKFYVGRGPRLSGAIHWVRVGGAYDADFIKPNYILDLPWLFGYRDW